MSTRDRLFFMLDTLPDEQLEGLYMFLSKFIHLDDELDEEAAQALRESEDIRLHPERHKFYDSAEEMMEDILREV